MGLYQALAVANDLLVVCSGYQVCGVIPSSSREGHAGGFCNGYQVCVVIPRSSPKKYTT